LDISHAGVATSFGMTFTGSGAAMVTKSHTLSNGSGNNRIVLVGVARPNRTHQVPA